MDLDQRLRDSLTGKIGAAAADDTVSRGLGLLASELHRLFGTVLPSAGLAELSSQMRAGDFGRITDLCQTFAWADVVVEGLLVQVTDRTLATGAATADADRWPPPATTLDQGRELVRTLLSDVGGLEACSSWPELSATAPEARRHIIDRVEAEVGVRLALLADRARDPDLCAIALDDVLMSVVEDAGGAAKLSAWGEQLAAVDTTVVDGGTAMRLRLWSSVPVAEPAERLPTEKYQVDDELLRRCGLESLHPDERAPLLASFYAELEMRVGGVLVDSLDEEQVAEFERLIDADDHHASSVWLAINEPHYPRKVREVYLALERELSRFAPTLLAALPLVPGAIAR